MMENEKKEGLKGKENSKRKEEKIIDLENYEESKNLAYLTNKRYYQKFEGKNSYQNDFFIQYVFNPNLPSFSETEMNINCKQFNDYIKKGLINLILLV